MTRDENRQRTVEKQELSEPKEELEEKEIGAEMADGNEAGPGTVDEMESLLSQLTYAETKAAEYLDGWQRARAEFANAKKRLEKEKAEVYQNAAVDYVSKILPVLDDFDRAIENVPVAIESDGWFEGIILVRRKLGSIMENLQVERIEALGQPFDPNFHEALSLMEAEGVESGVVIEELQTGYRMGDRVIRPSLVNVAS